MKNSISAFILFFSFTLVLAQPNTEVYHASIDYSTNPPKLSIPLNISNNPGYDNQPSFYNASTILFSSTRKGQTDIASYNLNTKATSWLTNTAQGSEYSPLKIPGKEEFTAIRLDTTGLQLLYRHPLTTGIPAVAVENLKIGYHRWYTNHLLVASILVENRLDLAVHNTTDGTNKIVQKNVGRSIHKIPNTQLISFISKEKEVWQVKSLNPITGAVATIVELPEGTEDICWLTNGHIVTGIGNTLRLYDTKTEGTWVEWTSFSNPGLQQITRLAAKPDGSELLLVSE